MKKASFRMNSVLNDIVSTSRFVTLGAPVMMLIAALTCWFAFTQVQAAVTAGRQSFSAAEDKQKTPSIKRVPYTQAGYLTVAQTMARNNPGVNIELSKDGSAMVVSIADPGLLPEWFYALSTLQAERSGLVWSAEKMCMQKCEKGVVSAELKAYTQEITTQ